MKDKSKFLAVHKVLGCTWVYIQDEFYEDGIVRYRLSFDDGPEAVRRMCPHCFAKETWGFGMAKWRKLDSLERGLWNMRLTRQVRYFAGLNGVNHGNEKK